MQLTTSTLIASILAASTAMAAPAAKSMMVPDPNWTIEHMQRICTKEGSQCTWTFAINTHLARSTDCKLVVGASNGVRAMRAKGGPVKCGDYTVTSGWSDQFGADNGFTVLSVVDDKKRLIVWPSYTDRQVEKGEVVQPDQSYSAQRI
ncbi:hypothetical protein L249_0504 [Ophiocordyceps polyrhachis-furcata BCC 54312]|uniref:Small secreted protein n=1 Tax=Ophiocordyceps polyrhachis-furcata BCC 54312 TaxID=1330021 RepID=A0A367LE87_9HYPO|nr:hypothetical protein L249_0504 [Ophiocordyceps polyrhachis-furcata BCC 54312]